MLPTRTAASSMIIVNTRRLMFRVRSMRSCICLNIMVGMPKQSAAILGLIVTGVININICNVLGKIMML